MNRILFVCLGNICRSPLAEALFLQEIERLGLDGKYEGASCGTANYHVGDPPDPRTIRNALMNGTTITHVGRQFEEEDFKRFDLILPMDVSNRTHIFRMYGADSQRHKIKLMRTFDVIGTGGDVPDPFNGSEENFQEVYDILSRSVRNLVRVLEGDID